MPFPATLDALKQAGYTFLRGDVCSVCHEPVEVYSTPGKREIAMNPMRIEREGFTLACGGEPAVRHYETCNIAPNLSPVEPSAVPGVSKPSPEPQREPVPHPAPHVAMFGVNDPNHQLLAVGWLHGNLVCQFKTAKWSYAGVPEAEFEKLKKVPFAYRIFTSNIKGKYPATKLS
jgi:hypothetical protein